MKKYFYYLIAVVVLSFEPIYSAHYSIAGSKETEFVKFESEAKLEFIKGRTNNLIGDFSLNESDLTDSISGLLRVDLRTLRTGIETRDGHMRDRHLETDIFPFAFFDIQSLTNLSGSIKFDSTYHGVVSGEFYIHGVKRSLEADIEFSLTENISKIKELDVIVKFKIHLDDYQIDRPKALFFKLAETLEMEIKFKAIESNKSNRFTKPNWKLLE